MRVAIGILLISAFACREDPGEPDYSDLAIIFDRASEEREGDELLGPDPYVEGEERLSFGLFYEGGFSEIIPPGPSVNYFIFLSDGTLTYSQETDSDRIEGKESDRITLTGTPFWGGGIVFDPARDLSDWSSLSVSLKSNDIQEVNITVGSAVEVGLSAADYGYVADGEWHSLTIPLSDYTDAGVDLTQIRVAFAIGAAGGNGGAQILVDNVYME